MKFDDHFLDQLRSRVSIVELIGGYVRLRKSGKDHAALCPFHHEKTPSFWVSESKQIFKCFGCGAGGDVFKFLSLVENLSFPEAVARLAERCGVPLPRAPQAAEAGDDNRARLLKAMEAADGFFRAALQQPTGAESRAYLEKRGIEPATIERFGVGYASFGNELTTFLSRAGVGPDEALACGLLSELSPGQLRDRFRNRVMFPIRDVSGRVVAFGGRALGEAGPKYLNSPDTPIYKKGNHLYGLDAAKEVIRRKDFAILVEGYFDCIVPAQCGFANVVASLGTGLTENQVRLLGRYSRNVVISFDPDSAGMAAALRSIDLFLGQGFRVNVVLLPSGHDPDTFLREFGAEAYAARLKSSIPFLDFALSRFLDQQPDPFSPRGKQETVTQILPYLMKAPSSIERAEYVARIAERLQIDEELVRAELRRMTGKGQAAQTERRGLLEQTLPAENSLLAAALDPEWRGFTLPLLRLTLFEGLNSAPVFQKLEELRKLDRDINILNLRKLLPEGEVLELVEAIAVRASDLPLSEEIIRGSVEALQARCLRLDNSRRQEAIRREQALDPDSARLRELVREKEQRLREQRKSGLI